MNSPDDQIEQRARALFRAASQDIDPAMAGRLRAARREALKAPAAESLSTRLLLPTGAFAVLALATLLVWQPHQRVPGSTASAATSVVSDVDVDTLLPPDADSADPNLYQNLDFYGWLAANDKATKGAR